MPSQRRIGLFDLMILIAALAIGLTAFPFVVREIKQPVQVGWQHRVNLVHSCAVPPLAALTFASLGLAMIPPRPGTRRLARKPGFATLATAAAYIVLISPIAIAGYLYMYHGMLASGPPSPDWWVLQIALLIGIQGQFVGLMVLGCWVGLLLNGRLRPRDQLDWLGLAIGGCWIVLFASAWLVYLG